jgi:hypothetical protein
MKIDFLVDHIVIIGYETSISYFLKYLQIHFKHKQICFLTNSNKNDEEIIKLIKKYKNLFCLKGDFLSLNNLKVACLDKAKCIIIIPYEADVNSEQVEKNYTDILDFKPAIAFKIIEYYFNIPTIIDLPHYKKNEFLGSVPVKDNKVEWHHFLHPLFLSGKLLYSNYLDSFTSLSYTDRLEMECLVGLIGLYYQVDNTKNKKTNVISEPHKHTYTISIPVSSNYYGKNYITLINDLMALDTPVLPLGIYIEDPLKYAMTLRETYAELINPQILKSEDDPTLNDKVKDFNRKFKKYLDFMKQNSHTKKAAIDSVQMDLLNVPIFITNPNPDFKLDQYMKVLLISPFNYLDKSKGLEDYSVINENLDTHTNLLKKSPSQIKKDQIKSTSKKLMKMIMSFYKKLKESTN